MAEALWNRNGVKTAVRIEFGILYSGCTPSARRPETRRGGPVAQGALDCMKLRVARSGGTPQQGGDDRSSPSKFERDTRRVKGDWGVSFGDRTACSVPAHFPRSSPPRYPELVRREQGYSGFSRVRDGSRFVFRGVELDRG